MATDHREKLAWGRKHFDALNAAIQVFQDSDPYEMAVKVEGDGRHYVAYFKSVKSIPREWSLMIGDIVHSFRSCLDAVTYSLSVANLGREPDHDEARRIQFPIIDDGAHWPNECKRRLAFVSSQAVAAIDRLQPYNRAYKAAKTELSLLRDLSNVDKHRRLLLTLAVANTSGVVLNWPWLKPGVTVQGGSGRIEQGAVITKWHDPYGPGGLLDAHMNMSGNLGFDVEFAPSWVRAKSVRDLLPRIHDHIERIVLPPLEALL